MLRRIVAGTAALHRDVVGVGVPGILVGIKLDGDAVVDGSGIASQTMLGSVKMPVPSCI